MVGVIVIARGRAGQASGRVPAAESPRAGAGA
jgi:hypothetical protein